MTSFTGLAIPSSVLVGVVPADDSPRVSRDIAPGTRVGGRYRIDGVVGRGGMGVVYAAEDQARERHVALKFVSWGGEADPPERNRRFVTEVRNATAVRHPHVVEVFDVGVHEGEPYLVMEFLVGESLEQRLNRVGALSAEEALALLLPVASALAALHACGIVHRDVKPSNIFLAEVGGAIVPKLLDFGISRVVADGRTTLGGTVVGTPMYMAPEHAAGGGATPASEVWSLAVVLYECLTGKGPYLAVEPAALANLVLTGSVLPLAVRDPSLPPHLCKVIESGLVRNEARRCRDIGSLGVGLLSAAIADGIALPPERALASDPHCAAWLAAAQRRAQLDDTTDPGLTPTAGEPARWRVPLAVLVLAAAVAVLAGWGAVRGAASVVPPNAAPAVPAAESREWGPSPSGPSPSVEPLQRADPSGGLSEPASVRAQVPRTRAVAPADGLATRAPKVGAVRARVVPPAESRPSVPRLERGAALDEPAPAAAGALETRWE
jgi:eukaryotic-like serine/threonine-protein kinase